MSKKSPPRTESAPHRRARSHLKRILQTTALTGAALTLGSSCEMSQPVVTDPVPEPMCSRSPLTSDLLAQDVLLASAVWTTVDGGAPVVSVALNLRDESESLVFDHDPALSGATTVLINEVGDNLNFMFLPDPGVTKVLMVIEFSCNSLPRAIKLSFDVTAPALGKSVTVSSLE